MGDAHEALSVSAALNLAKKALEGIVVRIIGEVSEVSIKAGYKAVYFSIKDEKSSLPCMMWNNRYAECDVDLRVGMLVELTGRFSLYAAKGRMNFDVFTISKAGEGDLRLKVANLAKKLASEGLMDASRKRPAPAFATTIGLVTSPRGDAVHDVLRTLRRRFPIARVVFAGVPVEGDKAALGIIEGIKCVVDAGAEMVLVVRGGGSYEDLMPFNDEGLARAIASCPVPVITGIGHEPDTTIADMVADVRASTPTGAAQEASPAPELLRELFVRRSMELDNSIKHRIDAEEGKVERYLNKPIFLDSTELLAQAYLATDSLASRLSSALPGNMKRNEDDLAYAKTKLTAMLPHLLGRYDYEVKASYEAMQNQKDALLVPYEHAMSLAASRLHDLSPLAVLGRGYSMVQDTEGSIVKSIESIAVDDRLDVFFSDGGFTCVVTDIPPCGGDMRIVDLNDLDDRDDDTDPVSEEWKETLW
ncbi:MAG: exodeoxyribonuclease VII large subunit [Eggerthellaceae bacterium]|nr:exodeoxyribonuclease VII large subunit [Eggerthellaceae bacterium]